MNIYNERNLEVDDEETLERGNGGEVNGGLERRGKVKGRRGSRIGRC